MDGCCKGQLVDDEEFNRVALVYVQRRPWEGAVCEDHRARRGAHRTVVFPCQGDGEGDCFGGTARESRFVRGWGGGDEEEEGEELEDSEQTSVCHVVRCRPTWRCSESCVTVERQRQSMSYSRGTASYNYEAALAMALAGPSQRQPQREKSEAHNASGAARLKEARGRQVLAGRLACGAVSPNTRPRLRLAAAGKGAGQIGDVPVRPCRPDPT
jgi:hypothetical protein